MGPGPDEPASVAQDPRPRAVAWWSYPAAWALVFLLGLVLGALAHVERPMAPTDLDERVVGWVKAHRAEHPTMVRLAKFVTRSGNLEFTVPAVVGISILLLALKRRDDFAGFVIVAIGGQVLATALKEVFRRDRPDLAGRLALVRGYSFPSGHSVFAGVVVVLAAVAVVRLVRPGLWPIRAALIGAFAAFSAAVASTRVWLGVHYLTDVLSGLALGLSWASAVVAVRFDGGRIVRWRRRKP